MAHRHGIFAFRIAFPKDAAMRAKRINQAEGRSREIMRVNQKRDLTSVTQPDMHEANGADHASQNRMPAFLTVNPFTLTKILPKPCHFPAKKKGGVGIWNFQFSHPRPSLSDLLTFSPAHLRTISAASVFSVAQPYSDSCIPAFLMRKSLPQTEVASGASCLKVLRKSMAEKSLPIWEIAPAIASGLTTGTRLVLVAPTGSGKTTQVPQMLFDA